MLKIYFFVLLEYVNLYKIESHCSSAEIVSYFEARNTINCNKS